jgi:toxin ParE1/3/4
LTQYIIAPEAALDLDEISTYYTVHNIEAGEKLLDEFETRCKYLVSFPNIGRSYKSLRTDSFRAIGLYINSRQAR